MYLSSMRSDKLKRLLEAMPLEQKTKRSMTDPKKLLAELSLTRQRGYATDNLSSIFEAILCVKLANASRDALAQDARFFVNQNAHDSRCGRDAEICLACNTLAVCSGRVARAAADGVSR